MADAAGIAPGVVQPADVTKLVVTDLKTGYSGQEIVHGLSFEVAESEVVAMIGHNGAGKTTALKATSGLLGCYEGTVELFGRDVTRSRIRDRVDAGLVYLPQEGALFRGLTVRENLLLGAASETDKRTVNARFDDVYSLFPILRDRSGQVAGSLSGGQQRMVSIGIALMAGARVLLLDEPSLGLAPVIYEQMLEVVTEMASARGLAVIIVEQVVGRLATLCDRIYVIRSGALVKELPKDEAQATKDWSRLL